MDMGHGSCLVAYVCARAAGCGLLDVGLGHGHGRGLGCGLRLWFMGCGLWAAGCGVWVMGLARGSWVVGDGLWVRGMDLGDGLCVMGYGFGAWGAGYGALAWGTDMGMGYGCDSRAWAWAWASITTCSRVAFRFVEHQVRGAPTLLPLFGCDESLVACCVFSLAISHAHGELIIGFPFSQRRCRNVGET